MVEPVRLNLTAAVLQAADSRFPLPSSPVTSSPRVWRATLHPSPSLTGLGSWRSDRGRNGRLLLQPANASEAATQSPGPTSRLPLVHLRHPPSMTQPTHRQPPPTTTLHLIQLLGPARWYTKPGTMTMTIRGVSYQPHDQQRRQGTGSKTVTMKLI